MVQTVIDVASDDTLLNAAGEIRSINDWALKAGVSTNRIKIRLRKGWTPEQAVGYDRPPGTVQWQGKQYTIPELAKKAGVTRQGFHRRLKAGQTVDEIMAAFLHPKEKQKSKNKRNPHGYKLNKEYVDDGSGAIKFEWNGEVHTLYNLAKMHGLPVANVLGRLNYGWPLRDALLTPTHVALGRPQKNPERPKEEYVPPPDVTKEELTQFRQSRGWTYSDLAIRAGYGSQVIGVYERGEADIPVRFSRWMRLWQDKERLEAELAAARGES